MFIVMNVEDESRTASGNKDDSSIYSDHSLYSYVTGCYSVRVRSNRVAQSPCQSLSRTLSCQTLRCLSDVEKKVSAGATNKLCYGS